MSGLHGQPPVYKTPKQLEKRINDYFEYVKGEKRTEVGESGLVEWIRPPEIITITGLCYFLDFESRQSFYDYEKRPGFSYIIKKARLLVENRYEKALANQQVAGAIFALKNMGWSDRMETEIIGSIPVQWKEEKTYEGESKTEDEKINSESIFD